jgi:Ran GTPase-activating protein (RanGAP) involved in mRNA processing and transport
MTYFSAEQPRFMSKSESDKLFQAQLSKDGKILDLTAMHLEEMGAKDVSNCEFISEINGLEFGNNLCGSKGARHIAKSKYLTNLTSLNLFYNRILDEGCKHIAVSDNLISVKNLNLSDNEIGDEGAFMLARFLPLFTNLVRLDLRYNRLQEDGKAAMREAQKVMSLKHLLLDKDEGYAIEEKGSRTRGGY